MTRGFRVTIIVLLMVVLLVGCTASPTDSKSAPVNTKAATTTAAQPQSGGILKMMDKSAPTNYGHPITGVGADNNITMVFFDPLLSIGEDRKFQPELATSWDVSADGKTITFKLRQGVKFHDGTDFNAQAVKSNIDLLIPPKASYITSIDSVQVIDDYTVKLNLKQYDNLLLYTLAISVQRGMYSPTALAKNGMDWARTNPVGTGPYMQKEFVPKTSLSVVRNPNYWKKGLPYLDGIELTYPSDNMSQILSFQSGQVNALFDIVQGNAPQLKAAGYELMTCVGNLNTLSFNIKDSILADPRIRQALEYAMDKESICSGPGGGFLTPAYQIATNTSPNYNPACPPRKYNPAKAKELLAAAGYPRGFSFKVRAPNTIWQDGLVALQANLADVGIKMDLDFMTTAAFAPYKTNALEPGLAMFTTILGYQNTLLISDSNFRSKSNDYSHITKPAGLDTLIDQAKSLRDPDATIKANQQIIKILYDDATVMPLYFNQKIAVTDKSVQNIGWFVGGEWINNQLGHQTWLKK